MIFPSTDKNSSFLVIVFPLCVSLKKTTSGRQTIKEEREATDKNISIFKFKSLLYPSPIYSLCLQKNQNSKIQSM